MTQTIPELEVGQVWLCRDQRYTAMLTRSGNCFTGAILDYKRAVKYRYMYAQNSLRNKLYYGVFNGRQDPHDLVQLIYDPKDPNV